MPLPPPKLPRRKRVWRMCRRNFQRFRNTLSRFVRPAPQFACFTKNSVPADTARCLEGEVIGSYKILSEIDKGTFGAVYRCQHVETKKLFAAKYYSLKWLRSENGRSMSETELRVMRRLNHPNTVTLEEVIFVPDGTLIVMELVYGRTLLELLPKRCGMIEPFVRHIFSQLLDGLQYLHQHRIVHRDIKLENIMIDQDGNVKIIDYGLAEYIPRNFHKTGLLVVDSECGSLNYFAPEIIMSEGQYYRGDVSDIWAAGVLLYTLTTGNFPFDDDNEQKLRTMIHCFDDFLEDVLHEDEYMSEELRDFLRRILVKRPSKRATIAQLKEHPWIRGGKLDTKGMQTYTGKSRKLSVTFHDETPQCSLTSVQQFRHKKGALDRQSVWCAKSHSVPNAYKPDAKAQCHVHPACSSKASVTSTRRLNENAKNLLSRVLRSPKCIMLSNAFSRSHMNTKMVSLKAAKAAGNC